jgi:catalase
VITPREAVDAINDRYGVHAQTRALHAKGILVHGRFTASPEAARLTRAPHMQGDPVEATVRFSNGAGDPASPDYEPDVRGMATKLYLPDGSKTDISAQTVPRFPSRTPEDFIALMKAAAPGLGRVVRLPVFLATHPRVVPTLKENAPTLKPPASFATIPYYAIHSFKWVGADGGERYVRYRWRPEAGEERISPGEAKERGRDYLSEEITRRLEQGPVRFTLEVQVARDGDPVDDPTAGWSADRETIDAGTLELTELETGRETGDDVLVFDPARVTDGIELSDDPVLNFRPDAYSVSVEKRSGIPPSERAP